MQIKAEIFIVVLALMLRVLIAIPIYSNSDKMLEEDSPSYLKIAKNITEGNGYSNCITAPYYKDVLRTPSYPLVLSAVKLVSKDLLAIYFLQLILDLFSTILIFRIGRFLFSKAAGVIAGALYSMSMVNVVMVTQILAETSFVFFMLLSFYFLICRKGEGRFILAGIFLSLAILCKPIGLYLGIIFLLYLTYNKLHGKVNCRNMIGFFIPILLLIGGWAFRNENITETFTVSSISSYSLYAYNANAIIAYQRGVEEHTLREERIQEIYKNTKGELADYSGDYDYISVFGERGRKIILENLPLYIYLHFKADIGSVFPAVNYVQKLYGETGKRNTVSVLHKEGIIKSIQHYFAGRWALLFVLLPWILVWIATLALAAIEGVNSIRKKDWEIVLLIIIPGLYFFAIPGPAAEPRFGAMIAPFACLLAGMQLVKMGRLKVFVLAHFR